ncbi:hypothetical protein COO60DRAFT_1473949 [Scenedesmus sp. NREL 46B-D3]|nr:hypothetical protein COO60DRAFT_1473949 [Scenedesmus sp. NREL 46B-D3]
MEAVVRDQSQGDAQFSGSGSEVKRQRMSDDANYQPGHPRSTGAAAAAGGVGDSDSAASYRAAQPHIAITSGVEQQLLRLQSQQGAALAAEQHYGGDLSRLLELRHASSYSLGPGAGSANLAAVMAAAKAAAAVAAAAAATETTGTSKDDCSEDERVRRRREINRNSQKRIRERRTKEMESVRHESEKLQQDNDLLLRQVEGLTLEKADMLRQIQDLTEKWQQSIAENAWLNRENIQLRNSLQQLNSLVAGSTGAAAGLQVPSSGGMAGAAGAGGGSGSAAAGGMGVLGSLALGLKLPRHGLSSTQG